MLRPMIFRSTAARFAGAGPLSEFFAYPKIAGESRQARLGETAVGICDCGANRRRILPSRITKAGADLKNFAL